MKYIVALTSWKKRIQYAGLAIYMMLRQSITPKKIILTLSEAEFPHKFYDLPVDIKLMALCEPLLEIHWERENTKAFKKVIHVIKAHKSENIYILSIDDDVYYNQFYAEHMINTARKHPNHYLTPGTWGPQPHGYAMIYNPIWFKDNILWSLTLADMKTICASDEWIWEVLKRNHIAPFIDKDITQYITDLHRPNKLSEEYANANHTEMRRSYIKRLLNGYTK